MDWDDARHFLAVAREGQILSASKRLGVSQAKLSRRISALEAALGHRLLERTPKGSRLTEKGEALFHAAERAETAFLTASNAFESSDNGAGTVRIGAPDGFGGAFLAARLGQFRQAYPAIRIQLVPMPRNFSLSEREADIAIMVGRPEKGRLRARRLPEYTLGLYASRSYLARRGHPQNTADLGNHDLIGYVEDLIYSPELNYNAEIYRAWQSSIEVATAIGQFEAVRAGAGIGVLHDFMAAKHADLVGIFPEIRITRSYWTVWHENLNHTRRIEAVVGFLDQCARAESELFIRQQAE